MLLLTLLAAPASAYESDPAELLFVDEHDVFAGIEYDSGRLPSSGPVGIRFTLESLGGAYAEIEGESTLSWPDPLTHGLHGYPGGGWLALVTDLLVKVDLEIDTMGVYVTQTLWSEGLELDGDATFDGMLLPMSGAPQAAEVSTDGDRIESLSFPFSIMTGVNVEITLDIFPRAWATLTGRHVETQVTGTDGLTLLDEEDAYRFVDVPTENPGLVELTSTWIGELAASLDVVFVPAGEVCVFGYCFDVYSTELPVSLAGVSSERAFTPQVYDHPLPSIDVPLSNHDFGEVAIGNLTNLEVPIENLGQLPLEGWASVVGSENITVFPEYFFATAGNTDGVLLTFSPQAAQDMSALLVIESNDPVRPRIEIPLLGSGLGESEVEQGRGENRVSVSGCGCDASTGSGVAGLWTLLLGAVAVRRRRS